MRRLCLKSRRVTTPCVWCWAADTRTWRRSEPCGPERTSRWDSLSVCVSFSSDQILPPLLSQVQTWDLFHTLGKVTFGLRHIFLSVFINHSNPLTLQIFSSVSCFVRQNLDHFLFHTVHSCLGRVWNGRMWHFYSFCSKSISVLRCWTRMKGKTFKETVIVFQSFSPLTDTTWEKNLILLFFVHKK